MLKRLIKDILIAIIALIVINILGQYINFHIPFNILTIMLLALFKIPGMIIVLIILIL